MISKEVVVSTFDKDISWINLFNIDVKVTVYRKGTKSDNTNEIYIPINVGRCVHTFFNHLYLRYDSLSDYTFFVQDYPFDHWENLIEIINGEQDGFGRNAALQIEGYFGYHFNTITTPGPKGGIMWTLYPSDHHGKGKVLKCFSNGMPQDHNPNINVDMYWNELFQGPPPPYYEFMPGGHFGITKEHALKRPRYFYEKIKNVLENDINAPWMIERLECYIFNPKYLIK